MKNKDTGIIGKKEVILDVVPIVPGVAMGPVHHFRKFSFNIEDFDYLIESVEGELDRFRIACSKTINFLKKTKKLSNVIYEDQFLDIFESQIVLLEDKIFLDEIENFIKDKKSSAAMAVFTVFREKMDYFLGLENEYFRERALDIQDLKQKLLHAIFGLGTEYQISVPSVVFADYLSPSDTVHFNRNLILGFVTDTGGKTSHAAIIARSLHLPYVINNRNLSKIVQSDDLIIVDAYTGKMVINPTEGTIESYKEQKKKYLDIELNLLKESKIPTTTLDGIHVDVMANVEFLHEIDDIMNSGANGIGLFRTEGVFLEKDSLPDEEEQYQIYRRFSEEMKDLPVVLRTLDAGGDKILKDLEQPEEQNPFLGWRAIRFCIDEQDIFKTQLRAILRANINNNIKILIPMVSCLREIRETKKIIEEVKNELTSQGEIFYPDTEIGIMIEIPAAAIMSDVFAKEVDFLSFGTNDLTQYTLAVDRTNQKIARLFNDMHPAVLRLMQMTIKNANSLEKEISICGELAGNPEAIAILLGLGLRKLSMSPYLIPKIKKIIRSFSVAECENLVENILTLSSALEVIEHAKKFYKQKISSADLLI
ncbi:MAG: phosphoenolpyruvate--protein phosphotransferase [Calditrichia bacterium]|nr:phosphoenolpyruvate--protein phosphotransferase [Calditrichia bacterium]